MPITHAKVSAKSDSGDSSLVRPTDWNADHVFSGEAGVGAGFTHEYAGYNTVGASDEEVASNSKVYAKSVTFTSDCFVTSIGVYLSSASGSSGGPSVAIFSDSGGAPLKVIAAQPGSGPFISVNANGARWIDVPIGVWLTAGTYWIAVRLADAGASVLPHIAYDGSGGDKTMVSTGGSYWLDWAGGSSTSNKYSIRASVLTPIPAAGGPAGRLYMYANFR